MSDNYDLNNDNYMDYLDNFSDEIPSAREVRNKKREFADNPLSNKPNTKSVRTPRPQNKKSRKKGLKWVLIDLRNTPKVLIPIVSIALVLCIIIVSCSISGNKKEVPVVETQPSTVPTRVTSHQIENVPVLSQNDLTACCESYACTMTLQYYGFDLTINEFVENYLIKKPVYYGSDGTLYGPDMDAAFAGDIYFGYGINSPAMAKCMNTYLKEKNSNLTAQSLKGVSVEELCEKYVAKDIPVMIWATANMDEPFVHKTWVVDYVDENSTVKVGDEVSWQMHEHCMVLIGFDEQNYYLSDSVAGKVSVFERATFEDRYAKLGTQAIVVQ